MAAPATEETENDSATEAAGEKKGGRDLEFRNVVALFLGITDEKGHDLEATEGLEYAYRVGPLWSVGVLVEYAGGDMRNAVAVVPFYWWPHAGWYFLAGPGIEFHSGRDNMPPEESEDEEFFVVKIGFGYEFELGKRFMLAPNYNLDFVDGEQISVYGVSFGIKF